MLYFKDVSGSIITAVNEFTYVNTGIRYESTFDESCNSIPYWKVSVRIGDDVRTVTNCDNDCDVVDMVDWIKAKRREQWMS